MNDIPADKLESGLLSGLQRGDEQAAFDLHDQYAERLLRLVTSRMHPSFRRRMDPEDVVQSAFRSFFRIVSDQDGPSRTGANQIWALLAAIAVNKLNAKYRFHLASKRTVNNEDSHPKPDAVMLADEAIPEVEVIFVDELECIMRSEIESHRKILEMILSGKDEATVAQANGCTIRTVYRVVERAVYQLKTKLKD